MESNSQLGGKLVQWQWCDKLVIRDYRDRLVQTFQNLVVTMNHTFREAKQVADQLAKSGMGLLENTMTTCPSRKRQGLAGH